MTLRCAGCGWTAGPPRVDPYPFRCANAGADDGDHVLRVEAAPAKLEAWGGAKNPFLRYRSRLYSWHVARDNGLSDADFVAIVEDLDRAVGRVAGTGFRVTPCERSDALGAAVGLDGTGGVWTKDETGNVSGSHKARHLMGVALYLRVLAQLGLDQPARPLAVASCGNAALAAAVVARALDRKLLVFVPDHASARVVSELDALGACVTRCSRGTDLPGDPSYLAFRRAVAEGALPFSCQGNQNGLVIEGAKALAWEMVDAGVAPDRVLVQVGGGALASACVQGFQAAVLTGQLSAMPRVHAVQTRGGYPLKRAYDKVVDCLFARLSERNPGTRVGFASDADRARYLARAASPALLDEVFAYARRHRSGFMWPWDTEPRSVAGGILDDETYDWAAIVEAMVGSGGFPVVVDEDTLEEANRLGRRCTGIDVDHTGSAGLAGLLALSRSLDRPGPSERLVVLFTGRAR
ncbi:MAG: pyridoxal-phosphate dependent enzyme [Bacteroidales bacterium]